MLLNCIMRMFVWEGAVVVCAVRLSCFDEAGVGGVEGRGEGRSSGFSLADNCDVL